MPTISKRGEQVPPSPIRKLVPFAEAAKKRGTKVYHLNIGQPDIETPKPMLDAVRQSNFKILEYSHSAGNESYRRKLVEYYARFDISLTHEQIIVTTGGSEAIIFAFMACLDPGDEIIVPEPFYANYNGFATEAEVKVKTITSSIESGFALPAMADFEKAITSKTKAILICNPNNPTGYLYSKEELEVLKQLCLKHDLFLFSDEAYREFCYTGKHFSAMNLDGLENNVIIMDTISKRYSACGARIGAFVTKNQEALTAAMKLAQARLSPPSFAQIAAEAAVDLPLDYFDGIKAEYQSRRDILVAMLNEIPGVFCPNPGGAFYAMAKLPIDDSDKFCQWILESFEFEGQTVMMAPGTGFYATPGLGKDEVRLAYVLNQADIRHAIVCLAEALKVYPGKTSK
ncbi:aspartate aminotransferase [Chitinophaga terrae (ex Kim and Jung 2007)]|uniref:Aspartate aminotransferase n=1 Tax=Chitinophaga terrae (ex Kim and Jung 2007) TaxID=408074 RepID=A0A1H4A9J2_9BACT|nr:pyridoxal phosphate-dependent aminotransferase [Chitinophaga terrae (ex Kim and Jung 2007)]GEP90103.1 aspartate aminotransferase [Chitinophaga terrae (ex Kim and Jung 2007)]SEA32222.1 aspartate aminotransferase [Chitinophaga terrae (ex Kim and Jung 2007)]